MAGPYLRNMVQQAASTSGTGTFSLVTAVAPYDGIVAKVGTGNTCFYVAKTATQKEWGIGTATSGTPDTFARTTVLGGDNGTSAVNFSTNPTIQVDLLADMFPSPVAPAGVFFGTSDGRFGQSTVFSWDDTNQFHGIGTVTPLQRLHIANGNVRFDHVAAPSACAAALAGAGAGNVDNGTHAYRVALTTVLGDSDLGTGITFAVADKTTNGQVSLTAIPTGTAGLVTGRKVYRSKAGGGPFYLLTTLADDTTTTYTDNTADASLGAVFTGATQTSTAGRVFAGATGGPLFTAAGRFQGIVYDRSGAVRNVLAYGATIGGATLKTDGAMTAASATLTSSGFAATDVGKLCSVAWAGTNQIANPTTQATVAVTGGGSTGGGLAAGTYLLKYTWATAWGETTGGTSESAGFTVAAGNIPRVTIPSLPANAAGANIYITLPGGATNTEILYATGVTTTTFDMTMVQRTDGQVVPTVNRTAGPLNSVIKTFTSSTSVVLADTATNTVATADVVYGWDDTAAFQAALDVGAGIVYVPPGNYLVSALTLDSYRWLYGAGWGTQICQRGGTSGHMLTNTGASTFGCGVYNITLNGFRSLATAANDAVHFTDATGSGDDIYTIHNCFITSWRGNGIYLGNQVREVRILSCYVLYCSASGLVIDVNSTDNSILQLDVGHSGAQNIKLLGSTNRLGGVKSFWPGDITSSLGIGYDIESTGNDNELSGCEAQDCTSHGFYLNGCSRVAMSNATSSNNAGDPYRLNGCFDCKVYGQVLDFTRTTSTSVINLTGGALRNQTLIAFSSGSIPTGIAYVQGTTTGNDIHVGPDGGYQAPAFPSAPTWTVVAATDVITTSTAHGLGLNDPVFVSNSGGALPASTPQIAVNTPYYVKTVPSTTTLTLSATPGGATIDFTGTGTGTQSMQLPLQTNPYSGNTYKLTLTNNLGVAAPPQQHQGQRCSFEFTQDATGGRNIAFENVFLLRNWTLLLRPSQVSSIDFVYDGTNWVQHGGITDLLLSSTMGVTTTSVSSTTTAETKSLIGTISGSFTCPPSFMSIGRVLRLRLSGVITTGGTAGTITIQVKFAGTVIASTGAVAPTISQANRHWEAEIEIVCRTVGAAGTLMAQGKFDLMNAATPVAPIRWPIRGNSADPPAAVTVDTTVSSLIDFQSITSNALHTVTCNMAVLEVLN